LSDHKQALAMERHFILMARLAKICFLLINIILMRTAQGRFAENTYLRPNQNFSMQRVTLASGNVSFFAGSVHHDWCIEEEQEQIILISKTLSNRRDGCLVIDVGMNDGFYSNMAAAFGCKVYAFEIQQRCIDVARCIVKSNGFENLVNIFHLPVTNQNGHHITLTFPKDKVCGGTFSFSGKDATTNTYRGRKKTVKTSFSTVSLDGFLPRKIPIDFIKIDTEGHEAEVFISICIYIVDNQISY
jgi:FkbM family methyltransferase